MDWTDRMDAMDEMDGTAPAGRSRPARSVRGRAWLLAAMAVVAGRAVVAASPDALAQDVADAPGAPGSGDRARPNILILLTDDQSHDAVGALGNSEIRTPHMDSLVERGFAFTNAYCMGSMVPAVCLPSRAMLMTGRSLWRLPADLRSREAPKGVPVLARTFREAGYATFRCGKGGNTCTWADAAFETNHDTRDRTVESAREHVDLALDFLRSHDGSRPFLMVVAPPVPHDPRLAPEPFASMYDPARLSLPREFLPRHPFDNGEMDVRDELLAARPRDPAEMRRHLADYYATISDLDHQFGRLLGALEDRGLARETIVVLTSDQGLAVGGRHGLMGKQNLYEHVKPPLVLAGPGVPHGSSPALAYLLDLFPTLCELAGVAAPEGLEGASLAPILEGRADRVRDRLLGAYRTSQRMVRDELWKLIRYEVPGQPTKVQLFDMAADPDEMNDLADAPGMAATRRRLELLLDEERERWGDPTFEKR